MKTHLVFLQPNDRERSKVILYSDHKQETNRLKLVEKYENALICIADFGYGELEGNYYIEEPDSALQARTALGKRFCKEMIKLNAKKGE